MSRNHLLSVLAVLVCVIVVMQFVAISFHLYWTLWWYDIVLHFLGGVFAGLLTLWLRFFSGYVTFSHQSSTVELFLFVIASVLVIGIGWEIFERILGATFSVEGYWLDTILDVILDLLGGIVAFGFFTHSYVPDGQAK